MWLFMVLGTLSFWVVITLGIGALFSGGRSGRAEEHSDSRLDGS